jgi:hypothetical protein
MRENVGPGLDCSRPARKLPKAGTGRAGERPGRGRPCADFDPSAGKARVGTILTMRACEWVGGWGTAEAYEAYAKSEGGACESNASSSALRSSG